MTSVIRAVLAVTFSLCILPLNGSTAAYREALPGYRYQFPRDHFEHEDFRTEWWYYTGNVRGERGERFGFELVFFRQGARHESDNKSAWVAQDVVQCGYCQSGQIMSAVALLKSTPKPSEKEIKESMGGNLCRCATYVRIREAIKSASQQLKS